MDCIMTGTVGLRGFALQLAHATRWRNRPVAVKELAPKRDAHLGWLPYQAGAAGSLLDSGIQTRDRIEYLYPDPWDLII